MARLLLIEDDAQMRGMLGTTLREAGHQVIEAQDGQSGIRSLRSETVDLVLTDILMPGQDGLEVIAEARASAPHVPVVAISGGGRGFGPHDTLRVARQCGATRVLAKPFSLADLLRTVDNLVPA
ncbi:MAG: response regulator [Gemmatimonadales bacterium]|nr:response regulator [Gemmatimonadales bacterium]